MAGLFFYPSEGFLAPTAGLTIWVGRRFGLVLEIGQHTLGLFFERRDFGELSCQRRFGNNNGTALNQA